jgi:superfamily II DNA or RNA helicase
MVTLRDYQQQDCDSIIREFSNNNHLVLNYATGLGKTIVAASVINRVLPLRSIFLCERIELVDQAYEKIKLVTGREPQREMAGFWSHANLLDRAPTVVATIQTLNARWGDARRMHRFHPREFGLIVCDETHHIAADQYQRFMKHMMDGNPNIKSVGLTATLYRFDGKAIMGNPYELVVANRDIQFGNDNGWLVPVTREPIEVLKLDYSGIHVRDGDFVPRELEAVLEQESVVQGMVHPSLEVIFGVEPRKTMMNSLPQNQWRDFLKEQVRTPKDRVKVPRRTIMFTATVAQAQMATNVFNRVYPGLAEFVHAKTPKDERKRILERFHSGETPVICNQGILLEGFDEPETEVILMGRPTLSLGRYVQMAGRCTRPLPGLVDGVADVDERRKRIHDSYKPGARIIDYTDNSYRHDLITALHVVSNGYTPEEVDRAVKNSNSKNRPVMALKELDAARAQLQKERAEAAARLKAAEESRRNPIVAKVDYVIKELDKKKGHLFSMPRDKVPPTEPQLRALRRCGIDASRFTKWQCSRFIGEIKKNNWVVPSHLQWLLKHHSIRKDT